jgi:hypothetical protein
MILPLVQDAMDSLKALYGATPEESTEQRDLIQDFTYGLLVLSSLGRRTIFMNSPRGRLSREAMDEHYPCFTLNGVFPEFEDPAKLFDSDIREALETEGNIMLFLAEEEETREATRSPGNKNCT